MNPFQQPAPELPVIPLAVVETETGHRLKLRRSSSGAHVTTWMPLEHVGNPNALRSFLSKECGYLPQPNDDPVISRIRSEAPNLPRIRGTSRLGWTSSQEAFLYGTKVYEAVPPVHPPYEFVAPEGSLLAHAPAAFAPRGNADAQREGFRTLWDQSPDFRLALSLATISPFLEIIGAPSLAFHLAGHTGWGKTTLLRLAVSAFAHPDSPLTKVDFSKDTNNYADAQLGILHNFPLLLDETTLRGADELATAAYSIATGRTKGRLGGPEQHYLPADPMTYSLVCFLSGEGSLREQVDKAGGAARVVEIVLDGPICPQADLPRWYALARDHSGWFGHSLMTWVIEELFVEDEGNGAALVAGYQTYRQRAPQTYPGGHPRTHDFLACVELGYRLAVRTMTGEWPEHPEVAKFVLGVWTRLHRPSKVDELVNALLESSDIATWAKRGFIPQGQIQGVAIGLGLDPKKAIPMLRNHGLVSKVEPRTIEGGSVRCAILTPEGVTRLTPSYAPTTPTGDQKST